MRFGGLFFGQVEQEVLGRGESGFVGLDNQGATCYLNALLQVSERREGPVRALLLVEYLLTGSSKV